MKKLLVFLKDYKKETVLAPLFKMLEAGFELFVPLVMAAIIDNGIAGKDIPYVLKMGLVLVLLGVVGLASSITAQYFAAKAAVGFSTQMKHSLFEHIQGLSFSEMDTLGTSTMITRMTSDANQVQNGINMVLRLFLRSPFIVFGAMVMAFTVNAKAAFIFVVTIPLLSIVVFGIMAVTMPLYKKVQAGLDAVLGKTRENLTGVRVIRAFHKEKQETAEFEQSNASLTTLQLFVGKISALTNPVTYVIVNAATLILIYTGAVQVDEGTITQGEVVALVNYMSQILIELVKLANLIITITKALACANRIQGVFEMKSSMEWKEATEAAATGQSVAAGKNAGQSAAVGQSIAVMNSADADLYAVEFDHVSMTYHGAGAESLSDIDFKVKKGQTIGIIGGTGSGKSSLVHLIPRFYDVTKGCVRVNGRDVREYDRETLRNKVGMVMQKAVLFQGSIRDNLYWGKQDASLEELESALEISQSKEFVDAKPGRLEERIAQGGKNLSGGQRQRLTIARAIVRKPEILILDDSASVLDYATDARLRKAIRDMGGEMTVFIVSQRTSSIQYADKIIVLEDGQMAGIGTHEELLADCEVYREIYESQA
ncbi:MAG: ABC transporter ATP-binding protein/permease [Blautia sp.]|nr:ABC transporter ATP-binding protein/permease [Lachnoclostridium sp.]MCM1211058.1 ABC transporter ATP-binding protein/permease [Blautia sp.]